MGLITSGGLVGCQGLGGEHTMLVGVFPGGGELREQIRTLDRHEEWLTGRPSVVTLFTGTDLDDERTRERVERAMTAVWERGHVPLLTWEPFVSDESEAIVPLERRFQEGHYDDLLEEWMSLLESWVFAGNEERRFYFRPAHEMNGDWYPWATVHPDATPEDYVRMWRTLHDRLDETALEPTHVRWIWSPNSEDVGGHAVEEYYPGDAYVDWLGIDGYNWGASREWSAWRSVREVFDPMIDRLRALAGDDTPLSIPEFGSSSAIEDGFDSEQKDEWIAGAFEFFADAGVRMANWFDVDKETDWAVFDGARGTTTVRIDGEDRPAYAAYRSAVTEAVDAIEPEAPRVLTDQQFEGRR
ncbi:endoglucanase family protein [Halalkalicoccus jeotgali B3]|nr:endoglucanase family protein [Halalkalicoccus jeotgali B3]